MGNEKNHSTSSNDILVFKYMCNFIAEKWINGRLDSNGRPVSKAKYADECDLAKSTITKIASPDGYNLPFQTIVKICRKEETSLSQFFSEFEKKYKLKY